MPFMDSLRGELIFRFRLPATCAASTPAIRRSTGKTDASALSRKYWQRETCCPVVSQHWSSRVRATRRTSSLAWNQRRTSSRQSAIQMDSIVFCAASGTF